MRRLTATLLEYAGYDVMLADSGEEGVWLAQLHHPDLIVMDVFMPQMSGIEAVRKMKSQPASASVPVIAYTACPAAIKGNRSLFAAVCLKSPTAESLIATVSRLLSTTN